MGNLPIWPPILALLLGGVGLLLVRWDAKRFDERMERQKAERLKQVQH